MGISIIFRKEKCHMSVRRWFFVMILALAVTALPWGFDQSWAQAKVPSQAQPPQQGDREVTVTDVTGRSHTLMLRMPHAQRKAAAERQRAAKSGETLNQTQAAPTSKGEVVK
jgi:hypothetical protein